MIVSTIVIRILDFYSLLIFAYVILSWFPMSRDGVLADIYRVLGTLAEPYIGIFRRIVPLAGAIDFSPLVALLVLRYLLQPVIIGALRSFGL